MQPSEARRPAPRTTRALFSEYIRVLIGWESWRVGLALGLMILGSLGEGVSFVLLVPLLALVGLDVEEGAVGRIRDAVGGAFALVGVEPTLSSVLGVFAAAMGTQALILRGQTLANRSLEQGFARRLRVRLFDAIVHARWMFFARQRQSDLAHALTADINRVGLATQYLLTAAATGLVAAVYLGLAFRIAPLLAAFVAGAGSILALAVSPQVRRARTKGLRLSTAGQRLYGAVLDHLSGMKTVKSYGAEARTVAIFAGTSESDADTYLDAVRHHANVRLLFDVGGLLLLCVSLLLALDWLRLSAASVLLLIFLFGRTMPRVAGVQQNLQHFTNALAAFGVVRDLEDRCNAERMRDRRGDRAPTFERDLLLEDVSLGYEPGRLALSGVSLGVEVGGTIAIVGPSGAGKSTIADLVLGLVVPDSGRVLVDGRPLDGDVRLAWRERVGYVTQDTFLFGGSVRDNLRWARPDATDEDMREALRGASADFVWDWPRGLDTRLGDRGVGASGGERQRLALARALLRRPALLVLDEATSHVDVEHERRIMDAVRRLRGRVTVVVITHRLASVRDADRIYVLDRGRVVESGSWTDLAGRSAGRLQALLEAQSLEDE